MAMITLQNSSDTGITVLTNNFIDNYMPKANGEFVKIYIYLLRLLSDASVPFSLEQMADHFFCTERDIVRALKYWENEKLLTLTYQNGENIAGIRLHTPPVKSTPVSTEVSHAAPATPAVPATAAPIAPTVSNIQTNPAISAVSEATAAQAPSPAAPAQPARSASSPAALSPDRVRELKQNDEIAQLLYLTEQYLGKILTYAEMQTLLFFYDELKLSAELIEYLIEYCVSKGRKSFRYIETVALAWAEEGVTTVAMAKEVTSRYAKEYFTIFKAMGINGRNPVDTEVQLMNKWLKDYGFTMDIIQEACSRTVISTGQASFQYADKILTEWKDKNVRNIEDIRQLDAAHQKRRLEKATEKRNVPPKPAVSTNRFNNFHQRKYDFSEYEKKLLNQ